MIELPGNAPRATGLGTLRIQITATRYFPARIRKMSRRRQKIAYIARIRKAIEDRLIEFVGVRISGAAFIEMSAALEHVIEQFMPRFEYKVIDATET